MICLTALNSSIALSNDKKSDNLSTTIGAVLIVGAGYYLYNKYTTQAPAPSSEKPQQLHDSPKIIPQERKKISDVDLKIDSPSNNNQKPQPSLTHDKLQDESPKKLTVTPPATAENKTDNLTPSVPSNNLAWREIFGNSFAKITSDHLNDIVWE